jgi:hypothetical protein
MPLGDERIPFRRVRIFLSWSLESADSSEPGPDAYSGLSSLPRSPAMKFLLNLASLVLSRLGRSLHLLKEALKGWVPKQEPVLIPIPIPAERRTRQSDRRHPDRDD